MADAATKPAKKASPAKTGYLVLYNAVSAALWLVVLARTIGTYLTQGHEAVYPTVGEFCKWTQTLAGMEVLHSLFGIVRAPVITTFMQVFSRYALVWGIADQFPGLAAASPAYSSMLCAWAATEVVRYSYFALGLSGSRPRALHWLRYHAFFVLYPVGISSEAWLIWSAAAGPARACAYPAYSAVLYAFVGLIYPPASYILYTHMMTQRRKVLKAAKAENEKATQ